MCAEWLEEPYFMLCCGRQQPFSEIFLCYHHSLKSKKVQNALGKPRWLRRCCLPVFQLVWDQKATASTQAALLFMLGSWSHRMAEIGRDLLESSSPTHCLSRATWSRVPSPLSCWVLSISIDGYSTTSLATFLITLTVKCEMFSYAQIEFPVFKICARKALCHLRDVVYLSLDLHKWKAEAMQDVQAGYGKCHGTHPWQESGSAAVHAVASTSFNSANSIYSRAVFNCRGSFWIDLYNKIPKHFHVERQCSMWISCQTVIGVFGVWGKSFTLILQNICASYCQLKQEFYFTFLELVTPHFSFSFVFKGSRASLLCLTGRSTVCL